MSDYEDLSIEDLCHHEGLDYKLVSGAKGEQLNMRTCQNPSCGSDKWKVYANAETGLGNCFSCSKNFNIFSFVRMMLESRGGKPSNRDVGLYIMEIKRQLGYRPKIKKTISVEVMEGEVVLPFSAAMPYSNGNHPYLDQRGITGEWAKQFHLRFCAFGNHVYKNEKGEEVRQSFGGRILFPVYDLMGELRTFQGRDVTGLSDKKYKFAGGLPGTGRYLYNGHVAYTLRSQEACIAEGPTDVIKGQIALSQFSETEKVTMLGTFGMNLTKTKTGDDQITAFKSLKARGLKKVTLMWDGESEAFSKALEAADMLFQIGLEVSIATLPPTLDPGAADATVIRDCYLNAKPYNRLSALRMKMNNPYEK